MLNEIMAEQSQDVNMEQGAIGLGENQVNVESQDGLGLQAVGGVLTTEEDEAQAEMMQVADEGVQDKDLKPVADDGAQAEVLQKTEEAKADEVLVAQVADKGLQDKEVMLVASDGAQAEAIMDVDERALPEVMLVPAGEGMPAEDVAHRDGALYTDKFSHQVEDRELPEVCILLYYVLYNYYCKATAITTKGCIYNVSEVITPLSIS